MGNTAWRGKHREGRVSIGVFFVCDPTAVLSGRFTTHGRKGTKCARYTHTQQVRGGRKRKGGGRDHNIPARGETNYVWKRRGERRKEKSIYRDPETSFQCMVHCKRNVLERGRKCLFRPFVCASRHLLTYKRGAVNKSPPFPPLRLFSALLMAPNKKGTPLFPFLLLSSFVAVVALNGRSPFAVLIFTQVREWVLGLLCGFLTFPKKGGSFEAILGSSLHSRRHSLTASRPPDLIAFRAI